jgi:trimeric autotransporter adhesin
LILPIITGDYALAGNTTGSFNIAIGTPFTFNNTEGSENIATGAVSMGSNTTGNANVAYGVFSLGSNATGSNNTALGSHADVTAGDLNNATAVGAGALVDASNKVRIGNTDVTSIGGEVGWTSYSDERIKDNIQENVPGLEFIKALRPVTYHFNIAKENALLGRNTGAKGLILPQLKDSKIRGLADFEAQARKGLEAQQMKEASIAQSNALEKIQFTGFVAQDVEKAANNIGYDFSGIDKSGKIMGLRYSDFVVPLVKAVQELSRQNEDLQKQINELKAVNGNSKLHLTLSDASLEQNIPNPFSKTTTISYTLPEKYTDAQIVISDATGKMLKQITVSGSGKRTINIDAATLSRGSYTYALIIDKQLVSSKKMILGQ